MIVFLNGKFVSEKNAVVSVFDRGFLYGDALFEGMLVVGGKTFHWDRHMERLHRGLEFTGLKLPCSFSTLRRHADELIRLNRMPDCMLRISITRGMTERTYSPRNARNPVLVITLHSGPVSNHLVRWPVVLSNLRLMANDPLMQFKTANKMRQVLARAEADAVEAKEAILLNSDGNVAEGTTSNVFWIKNNTVYTPALPSGALPGVTRALVLELCKSLKIRTQQKKAKPSELRQADAAFLTMTSMGIVAIESLDGKRMKQSPLVNQLWSAYQEMLRTH